MICNDCKKQQEAKHRARLVKDLKDAEESGDEKRVVLLKTLIKMLDGVTT